MTADMVGQIKRERDEARAQVASLTERCEKAEVAREDWKRIYFVALGETNKAKRERDQARRALATIVGMTDHFQSPYTIDRVRQFAVETLRGIRAISTGEG